MPRLGQDLGVELWMKREDLAPQPGGGTKVRKAAAILDALPNGTTHVITNGGIQSNHCRAIAIGCALRSLGCSLVLHGDSELDVAGNYLLMQISGAVTHVVPPAEIATRIHEEKARLQVAGHEPSVVPGGGHAPIAVQAVRDEAMRTADALATANAYPDHVVHASGTGGTQAAIAAAFEVKSPRTHVTGISVARPKDRGSAHVVESLGWLGSEATNWTFDDRFIGPGYAIPTPAANAEIEVAARLSGIFLDPTYTGKAMAGLRALITERTIEQGSRVLFWHTGGTMNLLSSNWSGSRQ